MANSSAIRIRNPAMSRSWHAICFIGGLPGLGRGGMPVKLDFFHDRNSSCRRLYGAAVSAPADCGVQSGQHRLPLGIRPGDIFISRDDAGTGSRDSAMGPSDLRAPTTLRPVDAGARPAPVFEGSGVPRSAQTSTNVDIDKEMLTIGARPRFGVFADVPDRAGKASHDASSINEGRSHEPDDCH